MPPASLYHVEAHLDQLKGRRDCDEKTGQAKSATAAPLADHDTPTVLRLAAAVATAVALRLRTITSAFRVLRKCSLRHLKQGQRLKY